MLIPIVTLLCLTALANLLLVINFFPVPSPPSNNEMSMLLSYSGPLPPCSYYSFLPVPVAVWCFEAGACSQRAAACQEDTCRLLTHMPPTHGTPGMSIPGVPMPGSQGISSLLPLSRPFPHLIPLQSSLPDLLGPHTQTYVNVQVNTWVQASKAIATFLYAVYDPIGLFVLLCEHKFTRNSNTSNLLSDDRSPKTKCLLP